MLSSRKKRSKWPQKLPKIKKKKKKTENTRTSWSNCKRFLFEELRTQGDDILSSTSKEWHENEALVPFECSIGMQRLSRCSTWHVMGGIGFFVASTETVACFAVWKQNIRMCKCPFFSIWPYFVFRSSVGMFLRQIGIDCNIMLEKSSSSMPSISTRMIPRSILQLIFELLNFSHLLSFQLFVTSITIWAMHPSPTPISSFSNCRSLICLNSSISKASKMLLLGHF